ncbi:MAG: sulfate transporter CysZ [Cycloclasticus sp.]|nr:sulfate transporter CysZ [Cycloclasticus sp.]
MQNKLTIHTSAISHGLRCFIAGIGLLKHPKLRRFVWIPLLINICLFSIATWGLWTYLISSIDALLPSWLSWLSWFIIPLFMVSMLTIVYYTFTLISNIIAAPFYGQLAKNVEAHLKGHPFIEKTDGYFVAEMLGMIASEVRKQLYYLVRALPLLMLSMIPGVNIIALPAWLLFSAWFLSFEYAGYTFENHGVLFNEQKNILANFKLPGMAFGGISLLATAIPIVNLFAPAIAVAGATKMLYERGELD